MADIDRTVTIPNRVPGKLVFGRRRILAAYSTPSETPTEFEDQVARDSFTWWSDVQETVTITTVAGVKSLPDVVVSGLPTGATVKRAIAMFKYRQVEDTSAALNDLNGAVDIQARKAASTFIAAINLIDQQFQVPADARGPGDLLIGDIDLTAEVDEDATYNFQFASVTATGSNLILRDVQCGLQLMWT